MQDQARAELGHRWGLGVSRAADPRGPSSGWPHTESHVHPPSITEGSPAPSQPQEGKWGSREQHVPFTGSTQGAQVDQATEQGQGSASWQEPGPCCPLTAGCSHGGAASSTTVGLSSEEREHELEFSQECWAHHNKKWCSVTPAAQSLSRECLWMLWTGTFHWVSHFLASDCHSQSHHNTSSVQPSALPPPGKTSDFGSF